MYIFMYIVFLPYSVFWVITNSDEWWLPTSNIIGSCPQILILIHGSPYLRNKVAICVYVHTWQCGHCFGYICWHCLDYIRTCSSFKMGTQWIHDYTLDNYYSFPFPDRVTNVLENISISNSSLLPTRSVHLGPVRSCASFCLSWGGLASWW